PGRAGNGRGVRRHPGLPVEELPRRRAAAAQHQQGEQHRARERGRPDPDGRGGAVEVAAGHRLLQVARRAEKGAPPRLKENRGAQGGPRLLRGRARTASCQEIDDVEPGTKGTLMRHAQSTAAAIATAALLMSGGNRTPPAERSGPAPAPPAAPAAPKPPAPGAVRLYVSDETGGNVIVVDPEEGTVVERIAVGKRPRGIRLSRDGKQLLIPLSRSPIAGPGVDESKLPPPDRAADGIGVLDLATHKMVRTYDSGQDPESFDISPDGTKFYVSNEDAAEIAILDLASGTITTRVKVGEEPEAVTLGPDG